MRRETALEPSSARRRHGMGLEAGIGASQDAAQVIDGVREHEEGRRARRRTEHGLRQFAHETGRLDHGALLRVPRAREQREHGIKAQHRLIGGRRMGLYGIGRRLREFPQHFGLAQGEEIGVFANEPRQQRRAHMSDVEHIVRRRRQPLGRRHDDLGTADGLFMRKLQQSFVEKACGAIGRLVEFEQRHALVSRIENSEREPCRRVPQILAGDYGWQSAHR